MNVFPAIAIEGLSFRYGDRQALNELTLSIREGEIFGILGPNGGGKTTLFRIMSTLLPVQQGTVKIANFDLKTDPHAIRKILGVTFQSPSLDGKLTVCENLKHQGHLYGISGSRLRSRIAELTEKFQIADRKKDQAETLSGGLKRRVEIAKGILHAPRILLLDEPSTGLDPGARLDLWRYLHRLRDEENVTIVVTTHILEEADSCDRLGILDGGKLIAADSAEKLKESVGGDCVIIRCFSPEELKLKIENRWNIPVQIYNGELRIEHQRSGNFVGELMESYSESIDQISLGKPTLEDVFVKLTGHRFWDDSTEDNISPR